MARPGDFNSLWMLKKITNKAAEDKPVAKETTDQAASSTDPNDANTEIEDRQSRADILGEDRPRVLAYSDSDSDVESHFKRVKDHLLPQHDEKPKEAEIAEATDAAGASTSANEADKLGGASKNRKSSKVLSAIGTGIATHVTPPVALGATGLLVLGQRQEKAAKVVQIMAGVLSLATVAFRKMIPEAGTLSTASRNIQDLGKASILVTALRILVKAHQSRLARRTSSGMRRRASVNLALLESAVRSDPIAPPETAADFAAVYAPEMLEMERILKECGVELPKERFDETHAELFRFAKTCNLLAAQTPAERAGVIEKSVRRVIEAMEWLQEQKILSESKLKRWERVVAWRSSDAQGHPILLVRAGRALQLYKGEKLRDFVDAVLAQVILGVNQKLQNPDGPDKMVVVVDCRDASTIDLILKSREFTSLVKRVAGALNIYFPERLEKLFLLELPLVGKAVLQSVLPALHPSTQSKISQVSVSDDGLPITVALLWKRRSVGKKLSRTLSDLSSVLSEASGQSSPYTPASPRGEEVAGNDNNTSISTGGEPTTGGSKTGVKINLLPALDHAENAEPPETSYKTPFSPTKHGMYTSEGSTPPDSREAVTVSGHKENGGGDGGSASANRSENAHNNNVKSHSLAMTPSMLTPQTSVEGSIEGLDAEDSNLSNSRLQGPFIGLAAFLRSVLHGPAGAPARAARLRLKAHHIPAPNSPTGTDPSISSPRTPRIKGGLMDLPIRPSSAMRSQLRKVNASKKGQQSTKTKSEPIKAKKPSLVGRLMPSFSSTSASPKRLGSFPLRRQSSVSWANELTNVREIEASPHSARASLEVSGVDAEKARGVVLLLTACGGLIVKVLSG